VVQEAEKFSIVILGLDPGPDLQCWSELKNASLNSCFVFLLFDSRKGSEIISKSLSPSGFYTAAMMFTVSLNSKSVHMAK
jgi:hypothetical protein